MVETRTLQISALEHHEYCPRQCALIHVDGIWEDNRHTVRGARGHRRVDHDPSRSERGRIVVRGLALWSEAQGLSGRADAVEVLDGGELIPVEYKMGRRHGMAAHVQLCAQAFCLEEMFGVSVLRGAIWFSATRRRESVAIDEALRARTVEAIANVRTTIEAGALPIAVNDRRCDECQLIGHCLPELTEAQGPVRLAHYMQREVYACGS